MIKDIYIIKNKINDKVYIGQSVNAKIRWSAHCSNARLGRSWSAIDSAIKKYGQENFYYEILEQTEDYDEREAYWIKYYNSLVPHGYNWCAGGNSTNAGTGSPSGLIRNDEELEQIIEDLIYSKKSQEEIAKEHNVHKRVISSINRGITYKQSNLNYPLRKKMKDISQKDACEIQQLLSGKQYTLKEISEKYHYSLEAIQYINKGKVWKNPQYSYPIYCGMHRKLSDDMLSKLIEDLQTSSLKLAEIAEKYSISATQVRFINTGKSWYNESLSYPLRKV